MEFQGKFPIHHPSHPPPLPGYLPIGKGGGKYVGTPTGGGRVKFTLDTLSLHQSLPGGEGKIPHSLPYYGGNGGVGGEVAGQEGEERGRWGGGGGEENVLSTPLVEFLQGTSLREYPVRIPTTPRVGEGYPFVIHQFVGGGEGGKFVGGENLHLP